MQKVEKQLNIKNMSMLRPRSQILFVVLGTGGLIAIEIIIQLLISLFASLCIKDSYSYDVFMHSSTADMILNGASYVLLFALFILIFKDETDELFKSFKGWKPYVAGAVGFAAILTFNIIYNAILNATGAIISDNANETAINSIVNDFPLASIFIIGIIGPICEELTYRVGLFSLLRRVHFLLAYFVTIVVFTLIHFDFSSANMTNELLNIPFYAFAAFTFTFIYEKFGLAASVSAHVSNNVMSVIFTILTKIR